jgi:hypothetical protein
MAAPVRKVLLQVSLVALLALVLGVGQSAFADLINMSSVGPGALSIADTAHVKLLGGFKQAAFNASNWSGMSTTAPDSTATCGTSTSTMAQFTDISGTSIGGGLYSTNGWIAWDFGSTKTVAGFYLWNFNNTGEDLNVGFARVDFQVSNGAGNGIPSTFGGTAGWTNYQTGITLTKGTGGALASQDKVLTTQVDTRYIRFNNIAKWRIDWSLGVSEVLFYTPEPATMAFLGLGAVAMLLKRRRK